MYKKPCTQKSAHGRGDHKTKSGKTISIYKQNSIKPRQRQAGDEIMSCGDSAVNITEQYYVYITKGNLRQKLGKK